MAANPVYLDKSGWHVHVEAFRKDVYPMFAEHGLTFAEALMLWELNQISNGVRSVFDILEHNE